MTLRLGSLVSAGIAGHLISRVTGTPALTAGVAYWALGLILGTVGGFSLPSL